MNKYTVYQINLTKEQRDEVNTAPNYPEFYTKFLDATMQPTVERILAVRDLFKPVAVINAADAEQALMFSNWGQEDAIERLAPMRSVSVGDVLVDQNGKAVFVGEYAMGAIDF